MRDWYENMLSEVRLDGDDSAEDAPPPEKANGGAINYRSLAEVLMQPVEWLWRPVLARGKLIAIAGDPGTGKSQISISMAATISSGGAWPLSSKCCEPGNVILVNAEDDASDTIAPRLTYAGGDLSRVFEIRSVLDKDAKGSDLTRGLCLQSDAGHLEDMLANIGGADLVIVDPISAYFGKTDSYKDSGVRSLMAPYVGLAEKHRFALVVVCHFNKSAGSKALLRVMGSLGLVAAARIAFSVVKDREQPQERLFLPLKNNLGDDATGYRFTIEQSTIDPGIEASRVHWLSVAENIQIDDAITEQTEEQKSQHREAKDFLEAEICSNEAWEAAASPLIAKAKSHGISSATLDRARRDLGIHTQKSGSWFWSLPEDYVPRRKHTPKGWR